MLWLNWPATQVSLTVRHGEMKKSTKAVSLTIIVIGVLVTLGYLAFIHSPLGIMMRGNPNAGTWEDDPHNWNRAFQEDPPADVSVIHSKYWESDHFTHEYAYWFEVQTTPEWKEAFLKAREVESVPRAEVWPYSPGNDMAPDWYAPGPVGSYDVWDRPGYHGSVYVDKRNGHMFFMGLQL